VLCADSQFFNGQGHQVRAAGLQDQGLHIRAVPANNAVVRIQQALHVPADIRHAQEWVEAL
jgi:hypothetical protein